MNLLEWLIVAHLTADFLLQTEYEAINKMKGRFFNAALTKHVFIYTLCFVPVLVIYSVSLWWLALIFFSHMFIDRRWPIVWWITVIKNTSQSVLFEKAPWLIIAVDQIFHLLVLVVIAATPRLF